MEVLLVIGAILGLLAIAGGPGLVVLVVRLGFLLVVAFFAFAIYKIEQPPTAAQHEYYCAHHRDPEQCAGEGLLRAPDPSRSEIDFSKMPAASPPPAKPGPIRIPLQDLPMPVRTHPQAQGWDVDDTSGPWGDELKPASARADRLLRRLHESEGLEVGQ